MNEKIDLTKILKDCPIGWKFYSSVYGDVEFLGVSHGCPVPLNWQDDKLYLTEDLMCKKYPIRIKTRFGEYDVSHEGKLRVGAGECTLFPSRDQRDWSKFTAPWYKKLIEPKFNVGQYITDGYVVGQITSIEDEYNCYKILDFMGGISTTIPFTLQDNYHLWTIQDAKDGDVLCCKSGWMCIFKTLNNHTNTFSSYCFMDSDKCFFNIGIDGHTLDKKFINAYNGEIYPATKEQRNFLFQKIKEAGYKWNDETKTLEKLIKPKFKVGDRIRHKDTNKDDVYEISKVYDNSYGLFGSTQMLYMKFQDLYELVPNKFDPKTLKPFDKVLARCSDYKWVCDMFSHYDKSKRVMPYLCVGGFCEICIPYNDETKHLVGTTEEAPEYYRYWED